MFESRDFGSFRTNCHFVCTCSIFILFMVSGQNVDGQNVDGQNVDNFGNIGQNVDGQNVDGKKKT